MKRSNNFSSEPPALVALVGPPHPIRQNENCSAASPLSASECIEGPVFSTLRRKRTSLPSRMDAKRIEWLIAGGPGIRWVDGRNQFPVTPGCARGGRTFLPRVTGTRCTF